jgi:hypothetical protein
MNSRLKAIMLEAGAHKNISEDCQHRIEFIAERIVKECARLFPMTYTDEQYQRRIDKEILKHFDMYGQP